MEHRWGIRRTLDVSVKLYVHQSPPRFGRLVNASSSGAYVATSVPPPVMTRVELALGWGKHQHDARQLVSAYVVRADAFGVGIEWEEFAPLAVHELIDAPEAFPLPERRRAAAGDRRRGPRDQNQSIERVMMTSPQWSRTSTSPGAITDGP